MPGLNSRSTTDPSNQFRPSCSARACDAKYHPTMVDAFCAFRNTKAESEVGAVKQPVYADNLRCEEGLIGVLVITIYPVR